MKIVKHDELHSIIYPFDVTSEYRIRIESDNIQISATVGDMLDIATIEHILRVIEQAVEIARQQKSHLKSFNGKEKATKDGAVFHPRCAVRQDVSR